MGAITGTLSAQTDLQTVLNAKGNLASGNIWSGTQILNLNISGTSAVATFNSTNTGSTGNIVEFASNTTGATILKAGVRKDGRMFGSSATTNQDFVTLNQLDTVIRLDITSPTVVKTNWFGTKAQYDALSTYDPTIEYNIENIEYKGSASLSANGTTTLSIAHGLGVAPSYISVQAKNNNAAGITYVTADSLDIKVNYSSAPTGILEYWLAYNL